MRLDGLARIQSQKIGCTKRVNALVAGVCESGAARYPLNDVPEATDPSYSAICAILSSVGYGTGSPRSAQIALCAARCSDSFLLRPHAGANRCRPICADILKHLL